MAYTKNFVYYYDLFKEDKIYLGQVDKLVSLFKKYNVKSVLDVGCGTGKIDSLLKEKGYEVFGIDKSKEMIKHAKEKYPEITFQQMDAENFKINRKFAAIIALDSVLTFLTKKDSFEKAIKNIVDHIKEGGILFFDIGFTEKLIPIGFKDRFVKKVVKSGIEYKKEFFMKRQNDLLITEIKIIENKKVVIEEEHIHRIISEDLIVKLLKELDCYVELSGNSKNQDNRILQIIARKLK